MDPRVSLVSSHVPQASWSEEPENVCRATGAGGASTPSGSTVGAEGAGGASGATPAAAQTPVRGCGSESLAALGDCASVLVLRGTPQKIAILNCVASSEVAVSCVIQQFNSAKAKP